jgi:hypothetical protein
MTNVQTGKSSQVTIGQRTKAPKAPAVPGPWGDNPQPNHVAISLARLFTRLVLRFHGTAARRAVWWRYHGDAIFFVCPPAEVQKTASFTAEREIRLP